MTNDPIRTLQKARNTLANSPMTPALREQLEKLDGRIAAAVARRKADLRAAAGKTTPATPSETTALPQAVTETIAREMNVIRNEQRVTAAKVEMELAKLAAAVARVESGRSAG